MATNFPETIKEQMQIQGISMSQLARDAQVGRAYLYRVLGGETKPNIEIAQRIAAAVGLSMDFSEDPC